MEASSSPAPSKARTTFFGVLEELRVLIVGGVAFGVVVAGVGSRLAMFILRVTSPAAVVGVMSDDGFRIGQVTASGTYSLIALGAAVGFIGAAAYRVVSPWLIGPLWFRRLTTGAASGAVVGAMLLHADGIDFRLLQPTWLAIGLFIALPALFGTFIGSSVDRVAADTSWTRRRKWVWILPVMSVVAFPPVLFLIAVAVPVLTAWVSVRGMPSMRRLRMAPVYGLAVRAGWLSIAVAGLVAVVNDITAIA